MLKCAVMTFPNPVTPEMVESALKKAGRLLPPADGPDRELKAHFSVWRGLAVGPAVACIVARRALKPEEQAAILDTLSPFALQALLSDYPISREMPDLPA